MLELSIIKQSAQETSKQPKIRLTNAHAELIGSSFPPAHSRDSRTRTVARQVSLTSTRTRVCVSRPSLVYERSATGEKNVNA